MTMSAKRSRIQEKLAELPGVRPVRRPISPHSAEEFDLYYVRAGRKSTHPLVIIPGGPGVASVQMYKGLRRRAAAAFVLPPGLSKAVASGASVRLRVIGSTDLQIGTLVARSIAQGFASHLQASRVAATAASSSTGKPISVPPGRVARGSTSSRAHRPSARPLGSANMAQLGEDSTGCASSRRL